MGPSQTDETSPVNRDADERLREQYTEIATLAGGLAHEIRNPLSTIKLNLQLLAEEYADADELREQRAMRKVQRLQRECDRLQKILDDFLRFVRITHLQLQQCNLNDVVADLVGFLEPETERRGIVLRTSPAKDLPDCRVDRDALRQVLLNLAINAQQAMSDAGELMLRTRCDGDWVCLDVTDTGAGMDAEALAQAFSPYFSTKPGGSGLGLPTARKIVEAHGGTIEAQSEPGRGTNFAIRLPAVPQQPKPGADEPS